MSRLRGLWRRKVRSGVEWEVSMYRSVLVFLVAEGCRFLAEVS